ncbi:DUF481 domain-containing protein [Persicobacter psychrovividus]|uniref:DUF481 domain-containing protein n=1 Tax=Persicobacter psychrovividus TaxID=387638 RepID=A0ABN6L5Q7_9BACT|nr:hypothetical protein PEPS_03840 [Persicobacter psychrovividus]
MKKFYSIIGCLLFLGIGTAFGQSDELILKNGDQIHGELSKLVRNSIYFDADYGDEDFKIDWDDIMYFKTDRPFSIYLKGGERYYATFETDPSDSTAFIIRPVGSNDYFNTHRNRVVSIQTANTKFSDRFSMGLGLGYTFTKAKNVQQLTAQANAKYRAINWSLEGNVKTVNNSQDETTPTHRTDGSIAYNWTFYQSWFTGAGVTFLSNDEQKLSLRTSTQARIGTYLARTHTLDLLVSTGMAWTNENYSDPSIASANSAEAVLSAAFSIFGFGDFSINSSVDSYANLNTAGRYRVDFTVDISWDLPKGFLLKAGNTTNYDSKPVSPEAGTVDYVYYTTFGWKF